MSACHGEIALADTSLAQGLRSEHKHGHCEHVCVCVMESARLLLSMTPDPNPRPRADRQNDCVHPKMRDADTSFSHTQTLDKFRKLERKETNLVLHLEPCSHRLVRVWSWRTKDNTEKDRHTPAPLHTL